MWNGQNAQEIAQAVFPERKFGKFELPPEISLRKRRGWLFLTLPTAHGAVELWVGDWAVQQDDRSWIRMTPESMRTEYAIRAPLPYPETGDFANPPM